MTMTLGSLFSGIGGLELGFERTGGFVTRWQVENDAYATRVLEKHWPEVRRYGDITKLDADKLERVDVIVGGFPCQDVSVAGKGAGLDGARSGLWSEYIRIVRALRPRYVVVENVPGLFVRGFGRVLGDLAQSGYDAEWQVLSAAGVGAPHLRQRVFIMAHTACWEGNRGERRDLATAPKCGQSINATAISGSQDVAHSHSERRKEQRCRQPAPAAQSTAQCSCEEIPHAASAGCQTRLTNAMGDRQQVFGLRLAHSGWWQTEPNVGRVVDGLSSGLDRNSRLERLGNAVVPQVAQYVAECVLQHAQAMEIAA